MCFDRRQIGRSRCGCLSRRGFMATTTAAAGGAGLLMKAGQAEARAAGTVKPVGPASKVVPTVKATFVRRRGEYGMRWPGAVYDGTAARATYTKALKAAAKDLNVRVDLRPEPIYSKAEAAAWVAECTAAKPDGLLVLLQDRQEHAWPTAHMAAESGIPTLIHTPLGTSFTTNTRHLARRPGCVIFAADDFGEVVYGLRMIRAHRKLAETRYVVLRGRQRVERTVKHLGTTLAYVPASDFLEEYRRTPVSDEIESVVKEYLSGAKDLRSATRQDVVNGVKSYVVARTILEREGGDAITMDCLGALGRTTVSLPCIAWSYMLDQGVPAACEADIDAATTHALVQYLFDRPGFQQDPVPDTSRGTLIGAHCTCATRLNGIDKPRVPYEIVHHHGNRDAVPRPLWKPGQRVTVTQIELNTPEGEPPELIISAGQVVENRSVPPAGGCVVSVELKLDGVDDCLTYPGFHQLFVYGDLKRQLEAYCQLYGITPVVV